MYSPRILSPAAVRQSATRPSRSESGRRLRTISCTPGVERCLRRNAQLKCGGGLESKRWIELRDREHGFLGRMRDGCELLRADRVEQRIGWRGDVSPIKKWNPHGLRSEACRHTGRARARCASTTVEAAIQLPQWPVTAGTKRRRSSQTRRPSVRAEMVAVRSDLLQQGGLAESIAGAQSADLVAIDHDPKTPCSIR